MGSGRALDRLRAQWTHQRRSCDRALRIRRPRRSTLRSGLASGSPAAHVFLCDYFLNDVFRGELLRVLNRAEAVNALKRAIYTGRVSSHQAKQHEEMQAVADALSLLANILMAWNTAQMQQVLDHWAQRLLGVV